MQWRGKSFMTIATLGSGCYEGTGMAVSPIRTRRRTCSPVRKTCKQNGYERTCITAHPCTHVWLH